MITTGRIIQIGTGQGKAFVIKPNHFTDVHYSSLPIVKDPEELISSIQSSVSLISEYTNNINWLIEVIEDKNEIISEMQEQINELNNRIYSMYQTTWR